MAGLSTDTEDTAAVLALGECPCVARILPNGVRSTLMADGTRIRVLRCVTGSDGRETPIALLPANGRIHNLMLRACGGQIVRFTGRPRLWMPSAGRPVLAFTVTNLSLEDTSEARMLRAGSDQ
ncbi:hypothetical protein BISA_1880 [Bifidobacterium saguini DSM 23967]|uniref:Uncharacterized protein n=1 Tax=Bifidobacterium saguini DSM 23967 TaxID=1437607 RepID=A0A087D6Y0_9BIFI|nr:hypothetical protein [Bifidobacterium saguini]KFI91280.1 hypothetical protein BISA_1880 [Bifidobacterium saguini DSM 23967]